MDGGLLFVIIIGFALILAFACMAGFAAAGAINEDDIKEMKRYGFLILIFILSPMFSILRFIFGNRLNRFAEKIEDIYNRI